MESHPVTWSRHTQRAFSVQLRLEINLIHSSYFFHNTSHCIFGQ